jgi:hypothetical protein
MNKLFLAAAALCCVSTINAIEVRGGSPLTPEQTFASIDTNRDGTLSRSEMSDYFTKLGVTSASLQPILNDAFVKNDLNKDGFISLQEWTQVLGGNRSNRPRSNMAAGTGAGATSPRSTIGARNTARMETLQMFASGNGVTDEDEEDDGSVWLDFSEDESVFCNAKLRELDACWHQVFYSEEDDYHYACVFDPKAGEEVCWTVRME